MSKGLKTTCGRIRRCRYCDEPMTEREVVYRDLTEAHEDCDDVQEFARENREELLIERHAQ